MNRFKGKEGFSLVELMAVVAILGLMSAIAVPRYLAGIPKRRLQAATRELYGVMQQIRLLAVKDGQSKRIRFEADFYYLDDNDNKTYDSGEMRVDLSKYHDIAFGSGAAKKKWDNNPISQAKFITFTPEGTANSWSVYLQNISIPSECFAVTPQTSGAVKIRWFNGSKWQ